MEGLTLDVASVWVYETASTLQRYLWSPDMAEASMPIERGRGLKEKATGEFRRFMVIFLYLWVVFGLLSIHKSLVLAQSHLDYPEHAFAIINAFIFAKVLLVGEHFRLGTRFEHKPLIYSILHKCFIFTIVLVGFHIVESVLVGVWHGKSLVDSFPPIFGKSLTGVLAVSVVCFVLLLPFFGFRELARVIGPREVRALLFGRKADDAKVTSSAL